ncbi:hypothetical protein D3C71_1391790 [compost metagenome]
MATLVTGAIPAAVPALTPPVAATPAGKAGTVDGFAFRVFQHLGLAIAGAHVNTQGLRLARMRVHAKGVVGQGNGAVIACQFAQALGHVHMALRGAVDGLQDP